MRRSLVGLTTTLGAALTFPGAALAHAGAGVPVATNFVASVGVLVPPTAGIDARTFDGDRRLWLRVRGPRTVTVLGALGEPLLRFELRGVFVNLRSTTAQLDAIDRFDLEPDANPLAAPRWHRVASGRAYAWHEHRLHALEPLARGRTRSGVLGPWRVPLRIDGRAEGLSGTLAYRRPGAAWPWLLGAAAIGAGAAGLARAASTRADATAGVALAACLLLWALRAARELYGRPNVGATAYLAVAGTSLVGVALLAGLTRPDRSVRVFTALLVGVGAVYEALVFYPVLFHSVALTAVPSPVARALLAAASGLGAAALLLGAVELGRESDGADLRLEEAA